jgi:hypothetical protein
MRYCPTSKEYNEAKLKSREREVTMSTCLFLKRNKKLMREGKREVKLPVCSEGNDAILSNKSSGSDSIVVNTGSLDGSNINVMF